MFLKINHSQRKTQWSITNKLTLLYSLTTTIILTIIILIQYLGMQTMIKNAEKQYIFDEVQIIHNLLLHNSINAQVLTQEINAVPSSFKAAQYRYYVNVFDNSGKTLIQTKNMNDVIPDIKYPKLDIKDWKKNSIQWHSKNGRDYLSMTAPIQINRNNKDNIYMNMIFDGSYPEKMVQQYRNDAFIMLCVSTIIIIFIGRFITKKGLSRLYKMINVIEKSSVNHFTENIDTRDLPEELIGLAKSYNAMTTRIHKAFTKLSDCSAELAHELRTPINNLILNTEITLSNCRSVSEYKNTLESNFDEFRRLSKIIDNVLFLARTGNLHYVLDKSKLNIHLELKKIIEFYNIMASEKMITISLNGKGTLETNLTIFQRLISNLLGNAIKFTQPKGTISVDIRSDLGKFLIISITDTGIGIPEDDLNSIFDSFYRIKTTQSSYIGGTGLGLAIVKSIMELHHGNIKIQSKLGEGTQISLWFPLQTTDLPNLQGD